MKIVWALLAILLGGLSIGGISTFARDRDWFDLLITIGLAWAAWAVWKRGVLGGKARPTSANEPDRPWRHR